MFPHYHQEIRDGMWRHVTSCYLFCDVMMGWIYVVKESDSLVAGRQKYGSSRTDRVRNFLFSVYFRPLTRPTQPPIQWTPGALSPGVKLPGRETDHPPPTSAEVKKTFIYEGKSISKLQMDIELKRLRVLIWKMLLFLNIISLYIEALVPSFHKPLKLTTHLQLLREVKNTRIYAFTPPYAFIA
jgi:hypothetical protein